MKKKMAPRKKLSSVLELVGLVARVGPFADEGPAREVVHACRLKHHRWIKGVGVDFVLLTSKGTWRMKNKRK